jgi:hypothetical protein
MRRLLLLAIAVIGIATPAVPQEDRRYEVRITNWHRILELRTGWNADSFAIVVSEDMMGRGQWFNPSYCSHADGFVAEKSAPGYETYYEAALMAYANHQEVQIAVSPFDCALDRPRLIGINVRPPQ